MTEPHQLFQRDWRLVSNQKPVDYLQHLLRLDIETYRIASFDNFGIHLSVHPAEGSGKVYDSHRRWIGFDRYSFESYTRELKPISVQLCENGKVQVWYRNRWRSVIALLKRLSPGIDWNARLGDSKYDTRLRRNEQQQRWWMANRKVFKFMDLPTEIRDIIYTYALGPKVEPYPSSKARRLGKSAATIVARMPNASLLFASRLIYHEGSNILFKRTPFVNDRLGVLSKLLSNTEQFSRIRKLELALSHLEYFKLFGMTCRDEIFWEPKSAAHILKTMQLDELKIRFAAPSPCTTADWLDNACQKNVVDWILDEAWPFIRGHPVHLRGYVKRSSRALYEKFVAEERERIEYWQMQRAAIGEAKGEILDYYAQLDEEEEGGVPLDEENYWRDFWWMVEHKKFPLFCKCRKPCKLESWTSRE